MYFLKRQKGVLHFVGLNCTWPLNCWAENLWALLVMLLLHCSRQFTTLSAVKRPGPELGLDCDQQQSPWITINLHWLNANWKSTLCMSVYIMRIKLHNKRTHTHLAHVHSLNMQTLFYVHLYVYMHVFMWWAGKQQIFMGYIVANTFAL